MSSADSKNERRSEVKERMSTRELPNYWTPEQVR